MAADYSNIPAAVREETIESLRSSYETATENAAEHRAKAEHYQRAADQEKDFAERDEERARQWKAQLDFAEARMQQEPIRPFKIDDRVIVNDAGSLNHGAYGFISGTDPSGELLVEFDRDGTIHNYEASQLAHEDGAP